jgi:hypothetical protein
MGSRRLAAGESSGLSTVWTALLLYFGYAILIISSGMHHSEWLGAGWVQDGGGGVESDSFLSCIL